VSRSIVPIRLFDHIGFTGTRKGINFSQQMLVRRVFETFLTSGVQFHHGCCRGADISAHMEAERIDGVHIVGHPSTLQSVPTTSKVYWEVRPVEPPLTRNRTIVDECQYLVACPGTLKEVLRSGTWATIRYARSVSRLTTIIWPNGQLETYHYLSTGGKICRTSTRHD